MSSITMVSKLCDGCRLKVAGRTFDRQDVICILSNVDKGFCQYLSINIITTSMRQKIDKAATSAEALGLIRDAFRCSLDPDIVAQVLQVLRLHAIGNNIHAEEIENAYQEEIEKHELCEKCHKGDPGVEAKKRPHSDQFQSQTGVETMDDNASASKRRKLMTERLHSKKKNDSKESKSIEHKDITNEATLSEKSESLCIDATNSNPPENESKEQLFRFHRSNILPEMIENFKNDIIYAPMKVELVDEKGKYTDGVSREAYTLFWKNFKDKCDGEFYRVPAVTPGFGDSEWASVARILCKGFIDHKIFPLFLAPAFMVSLIDEEPLSSEDLLTSFKSYNNPSDMEIIDSVLQNGLRELSEDDKECFLDMLGRCGNQEDPKLIDEKKLLTKVAHKCIIQMPYYVIKVMKEIVKKHLRKFFPTKESVLQVYEECKPTPNKLCKLLKASDDLDADESRSLTFLKQFIKGLNPENLSKILVLMTASSMISVESVSVTFTKLKGVERRPIFHTCGPVLELPSTYSSYREFRQEWTPLIESGYLSMDIV